MLPCTPPFRSGPALMDFAGKKMMYSRHSWVRRMWWVPQSASFVSSIFCGAHNLSLSLIRRFSAGSPPRKTRNRRLPVPGRESFFPLAKSVAGIPLPATFFCAHARRSWRCGIPCAAVLSPPLEGLAIATAETIAAPASNYRAGCRIRRVPGAWFRWTYFAARPLPR